MEKSKKVDYNLMHISLYSALGGYGLNMFSGMFTTASSGNSVHLISQMLEGIGVIGVGYYAWTYSKFTRIFKNMGLGIDNVYPIQKSKATNDYSTTYKFTLPTGLSVDDVQKKKESFEQWLGREIKIEYINKGLFIIEVYESNVQEFFDYEITKLKGNVPILVGKDRKGKLIWFELGSTEPHMYIAGNTGCGKSTALRSVVANLVLTTNVNLHLVDLKHGVELAVFEKCSCVKSFARTIDEAEVVLVNLCNKIEERYTLFDKCGVNDIYLYNKKFKNNPMIYEVLIVDEMIDFKKKKELFEMLEIIGAKARSCGVHMVLSTQRPDKDILNGLIKNNITNVLGLKTKDGTNSRVVCDENGLEKLKGHGHGMFYHKGKKIEIQTPNLTYERAEEILTCKYVEKKKPSKSDKDKIKDETIKFSIEDIDDMNVFKL